ncbi:restriction endonuclease subunit S [Flavobacterium helocola]|uniref:Restriction endonuclease subunit S n=1 Tax=Flavobacterium helocola TaxID=3139139 RepID=A0ABU9I7K0_9FLAO
MKQGWEMKTIGDVCKSASSNISQNKLANDEGIYPIFGASGLIKNVSFYHRDKPYLSIVKDGSGVGRVTKMEAFTSVIGTLQYLLPNEDIDLDYLNYTLMSVDFKKYVAGAAIPHIYFKDYKNEPFLWMPLKEQQRIVSILDEAFTAIDKAKANTEQNLKNAKELFESELQRVFSEKNDGWDEKRLGDITLKIGSGATPKGGNASYKTEGISLIRSMNVHDLKFKKKNLAFIDDIQGRALKNVTIEEGDVLLNITGASVARCCLIPKEIIPARVNQHVSIIRPKNEILNSRFLNFLLTSKFYKDQLLLTGDQGATRQAITKVQLENFFICFPKTIKEQQNIVSKLDALREQTKKLEAFYTQKLQDLEELKKSVLQKAFSGEF